MTQDLDHKVLESIDFHDQCFNGLKINFPLGSVEMDIDIYSENEYVLHKLIFSEVANIDLSELNQKEKKDGFSIGHLKMENGALFLTIINDTTNDVSEIKFNFQRVELKN